MYVVDGSKKNSLYYRGDIRLDSYFVNGRFGAKIEGFIVCQSLFWYYIAKIKKCHLINNTIRDYNTMLFYLRIPQLLTVDIHI